MRDLCGETKRLHEDFLRFSHGSGARLLTRTDPSLASETLAAVLAVNLVCAFGACGLARRLRVRGVVFPASRNSGNRTRTGGDTGGLPALHGGNQDPNHCDEGQVKNSAGQLRQRQID